ncbi:MAG: aminopeptidase P family protein [Bacilli bacterium]|jgi:Xaa-Pro aminopeptidase
MNVYEQRRKKVFETIEDHSIVVLFSGEHVLATSDEKYPFIVNKNFYYLTGINRPEVALILVKIDQEVYEYFFIEEYMEIREKWTGKMLRAEEVREISGINNVLFTSLLKSKISELIISKSAYGFVNNVYVDKNHKFLRYEETHDQFIDFIKETGHKEIKIHDIYPIIVRMRMKKDKHEIDLIKKSISLTNLALRGVLEGIHPGLHEYQLRAIFEYVVRAKNGDIAFDTIVASGKNATILHHVDLDHRMRDGQLVLMDVGASIGQYKADISRTYPVNGIFNPFQRQIYEIVLATNKAVIDFIRPGRTIAEIQAYTKQYLTTKLLEEELLSEGEAIEKYYYHNISHHLGLDTHDAFIDNLPLEEGNVITVEPGLYFEKHGIGVRIEDDILVTKTGAENLSKQIPKEIEEIEALIKIDY